MEKNNHRKNEENNHRKNISGSSDLIFTNANISNFLRNLNKMNIAVEKVNKQKVRSHQDSLWMLRMLITFFKLIGLATFIRRIDTSKKRTLYTFQYSEFGIIYNGILISLMIASNYLSIPYRIKIKYENKSNLTVAIELVQTILGTIVICTILFFYCVDQKSFIRIINRLTDIEHEIDHLYRLYSPLQRQRVLWTLILVYISNNCLLIVLLISEVLAFHTTPVSWLTDIVPTFHVGWMLIQYFMLVTIIQTDFIDVNRAIQNLSRTPDLRSQSFYQTRRVIVSNSTINQLLQLRDVHCNLCEISENVSNFYSLPILFGVTFLFLSLIYNGYYLLSPLLMSDEVLEYLVFSNTVIWLIYLIYPIFLLTNRITRIMNEMEKTGNIVHNVLSCAIGKEARSELKQFSLQILHRKIRFTANGYFTLDNSFLYSLIGTVVTYLVILVQFQMGSSRSQRNCTRQDS